VLGWRPAAAQVGLAVGRQRRGHADEDRVGAGEDAVVGVSLYPLQRRLQTLGRDVLDVGLTGPDRRHLVVVDVHGDHRLAARRTPPRAAARRIQVR